MLSLRTLKNNEDAFDLVPMVLAVVVTFALIIVGVIVIGFVQKSTSDQLGHDRLTNKYINSMNNTSKNFDSVLSVVNIAIIITVLAFAIGAIFLFTRPTG